MWAIRNGGLVLMVLVVLGGPSEAWGQEVRLMDYRPQWKTGDRWVIETVAQVVQARTDTRPGQTGQTARWQVTVQKPEKLGGQQHHKVRIDCVVPGRQQHVVTLWVNQKSMALRQVQAQLPVQGGVRTVTESYQFEGQQPGPVMTFLSALPVDLPVFLEGQKSLARFSFEANASPVGQKRVPGEIGFLFEVEQEARRVELEKIKGLVSEPFAKSLEARPVIEVLLRSGGRQHAVRQLWQRGLPWPVYSENGVTTSRLISVTGPNPREVEP